MFDYTLESGKGCSQHPYHIVFCHRLVEGILDGNDDDISPSQKSTKLSGRPGAVEGGRRGMI